MSMCDREFAVECGASVIACFASEPLELARPLQAAQLGSVGPDSLDER